MFQHIDIPKLLPNAEDNQADKKQNLLENFIEIISDLKLTFTSAEQVVSFKSKVLSWFSLFDQLYQTKDFTPYMHALFCHVPEFLTMHQNLNYFNQQGMEKYNETSSKHYFRASNHRGIESLKQMFLKKNRIGLQLLEAAGYERVKGSCKCRNCRNNGHTKKPALLSVTIVTTKLAVDILLK